MLDLNWDDKCIKFYENKRPIKTASDTQADNLFIQSSINTWKNFEDKFLKFFKVLILLSLISSIINSIVFFPDHSLSFILPAILIFLYLSFKNGSKGPSLALAVNVFNTDPSLAFKIDFICLFPTNLEFIIFKFSITNLGSLFPEPNGAKELYY